MIEVHNRVRILPGYQEPPQAWGEYKEVSNYILGEAQRLLDESPTRRSDRIAEKKEKEIIGQIDKITEYYLEAEKISRHVKSHRLRWFQPKRTRSPS